MHATLIHRYNSSENRKLSHLNDRFHGKKTLERIPDKKLQQNSIRNVRECVLGRGFKGPIDPRGRISGVERTGSTTWKRPRAAQFSSMQ